uniref:uncharacterized protein LOC117609093 n=1 Tax=Osmia lignaria TaxID=473952 RepID=UPI001478699F|nr:uncharacterized protein LOC117609093 [Osmia lignaria]XP_034190885.1 uncharacterized protein LOC117609093 [Osmia lignaria]
MEEEGPGPSSASPTKRNPSGKFVESSQKMMIVDLYKSLKEEHPEMKYRPLIQLLSKQTGIGQLTISKTVSEYKSTGTVKSPNKKRPRMNILEKTSEEDILAIRRKVHEFWFRREIPNVRKILEAVNQDPELPSFSESSLYRLLKRIEFKYIVRARNSALIDKEHIVAWRQRYIQQIQKYRSEERPIYFLDETWVNAGDVRRKFRVDTSVTCPENAEQRSLSRGIPASANKGKQLIIGHVGSSDGFVPGALLCFEAKKNSAGYHDEMNSDTFFDWFRSILPMLRDGGVIVMDSASYHSTKLEKYPTMSWKKNDIITWLVAKGEKVEPQYVKAQLVQLSRKLRRYEYVIDEYAKQHGHTVVRLPPYHCELSPIELAWAKIKEYVRARNTTCKLSDVHALVLEAVENVSAESWQNFIRHTTEEENRFCQLDQITDSTLDESGEWVDQSDDSDSDIDF